ncbi:MAG: hypothetical protein GJ680_18385 [Alteromonadaceae bacterium]|nr:hypothetical protein [Alteromonadaceae bacterium]
MDMKKVAAAGAAVVAAGGAQADEAKQINFEASADHKIVFEGETQLPNTSVCCGGPTGPDPWPVHTHEPFTESTDPQDIAALRTELKSIFA